MQAVAESLVTGPLRNACVPVVGPSYILRRYSGVAFGFLSSSFALHRRALRL